MRAALCVVFIFLSSLAIAKEHRSSATVSHITLTPAQAAQLSAYTPQPQYPLGARLNHLTCTGIFRLHVSLQSGRVNSLEVEQSTGHLVLDTAATSTLKAWRFKSQALQPLADSDDRRS